MRYGQMVLGPAGSGKSTYCRILAEHGAAQQRRVHVVNLDPAAEHIGYEPLADIRELVSVEDVMADEVLSLGPNGGLVKAMEYLVEEELGWLQDIVAEEEDLYVLFDCPGQIELYTHYDMMKRLTEALSNWNFHLVSVFILDTQFLLEMNKFMSGSLVAMSTMMNLQLPAVNVLSKMDLLSKKDKETVEGFLDPANRSRLLEGMSTPQGSSNDRLARLTAALASVLDDYSLVTFVPLDISDEDSISAAKLVIDNCLQFGEGEEVRDRFPDEMDPEDLEPGGNGLRH